MVSQRCGYLSALWHELFARSVPYVGTVYSPCCYRGQMIRESLVSFRLDFENITQCWCGTQVGSWDGKSLWSQNGVFAGRMNSSSNVYLGWPLLFVPLGSAPEGSREPTSLLPAHGVAALSEELILPPSAQTILGGAGEVGSHVLFLHKCCWSSFC